MHETLDPRLQLHKGAVVGDVGNTAAVLRARRILRRHAFPRIGLELLHAQADTLRVGVEADDLHAHRHADLQRLGGVVDAAPRDIGDMQQPIDAAEIHERTVVGDVLDHAVQDHAFLEALDQLAALFGARLFKHGAARNNDVAARAVHLEDLERLRLAHQRAHIAHRTDIDLRAGQEGHGAAEIDGEPALDAAIDRAVDAHLRFERLLERGPGLLAAGLLARQHDRAVTVLVPLDEQLDDVAGLHFRLGAGRAEFLEGNAALALQTDIDDGEFVGQANDAASDDGAVKAAVLAEGLVEQGRKIFVGTRGCGGHRVSVFLNGPLRRARSALRAFEKARRARAAHSGSAQAGLRIAQPTSGTRGRTERRSPRGVKGNDGAAAS